LTELANELPEQRPGWHAWFEEPGVVRVAEQHHLRPEHTSRMEAFGFNRAAEPPEGEKPPVDIPPWTHAQESRRRLGGGTYGGAYQASDAGIQELFAAAMASGLEAPNRLKAPK
jgi:hypothetical protein